jgi:DNA adenine methylase
MSVPHPIPYQGSKRALASLILGCFPLGVSRLIEPFAGSAALSLAALAGNRVEQVILGDTNAALIDLWAAIRDQPTVLAADYRQHWMAQDGQERAYYDQVREAFNRSHQPADFLYLLARCVKAAVRYNRDGDFNQSPDNRRKGMQPETMRNHILGSAALLKGRSEFHAEDYRALINRLGPGPGDLLYLDPPYQGVSQQRDSRYKEGVQPDAFVDFLHHLNARQVPYILSYDGRTGDRVYGEPLPPSLRLSRYEIHAGRSTQATLLGRSAQTYESLYLSADLAEAVSIPLLTQVQLPLELA